MWQSTAAFALAVNTPNDPPVNSLTVRTTIPAAAEEAAIALALTTQPSPTIIITNSKAAIQNIARGYISPMASKILLQNLLTSLVDIIWTTSSGPRCTSAWGEMRQYTTQHEDYP